MTVTSAITPPAATTSGAGSGVSKTTLAKNFDTFLTLLTTQLKNQNPLEPLDTNQFTQQLVQFAQVEQQINMNEQMATLISVQKATQTSAALGFLGSTVTVDGATAKLKNGQAGWSLNPTAQSVATINIRDKTGAVVFSENRNLTAGNQSYVWNGRNASGQQLPDGDYTIAVTAKDQAGKDVSISTEVQGVVDSVDLTQDPPLLFVGGQSFTLAKIKRVVRPNTSVF